MKLEQALAFDRFVLDPAAGQLYGVGTKALSLTPKAYALLEYLVANAGRLATKRELLDALWPHQSVTDGVLKVCVRELRRALDDDARAPRVIETAHRRGYRFIAQTEAIARMARPPALPQSAAWHAVPCGAGIGPTHHFLTSH
jgi:DNA-binding winged helix-turn-helix (wHTH) protein